MAFFKLIWKARFDSVFVILKWHIYLREHLPLYPWQYTPPQDQLDVLRGVWTSWTLNFLCNISSPWVSRKRPRLYIFFILDPDRGTACDDVVMFFFSHYLSIKLFHNHMIGFYSYVTVICYIKLDINGQHDSYFVFLFQPPQILYQQSPNLAWSGTKTTTLSVMPNLSFMKTKWFG